MSQSIQQLKAALRKAIRAETRAVSASERAAASAQICLRLQQQPVWREARTILFYAPLPEEPDVWPLLAQALSEGKRAALPRYVAAGDTYEACQVSDAQHDLRTGRFGLPEPVTACSSLDLKQLDLTLVPGVAFALNGNRLGRGKGYYDRLLEKIPGCKCGVAFDWQLKVDIPTEGHDVRLNCILTPTRWQEGAGPRAVLK
jgi:5-formyltetrahydrofolate cyclo-ligase